MPRHITIVIPDFVDLDANDLLLQLAAILYRDGRITLGQGARMAKTSKRNFIESLGACGVSICSDSPEELRRDLRNA